MAEAGRGPASGKASARPTGTEWLFAVGLAGTLAVRCALLLHASWGFTTDDAYISLRYARNVAAGDGLTWNPGEPPVEGYSNFTFVLLGAGALAADLDPVFCFKALSTVALLGTGVGTFWIARSWVGPIAALLPFLMLGQSVGTIAWTTSGMETAVFQCLVVWSVLAQLAALGFLPGRRRPGAERASACAGVLAAIASMTRPEGPIVFLVLCAGTIVHRAWDGRRQRSDSVDEEDRARAVNALLGLGIGFSAVYLPYAAWRLWYFQRLLPNSVLCKAGYVEDPWALSRQFWEASAAYVVLSLVQHRRCLDVRHGVLWGVPVAYAVLLYGASPLLGQWNRHFLAALALLLVLTTVGIANLATWLGPSSRLRREGAVALLCAVVIGYQTRGLASGLEAYAAYYGARQQTRERLAGWVDRHVGEEGLVVAGDVGLFGYRTRARILDAYCLNSAEMTRPPLAGDPQAVIEWIFDREPDAVVLTVRAKLRPGLDVPDAGTALQLLRLPTSEPVAPGHVCTEPRRGRRRRPSQVIRPRRRAANSADVRFLTPSLAKMFLRCVFTMFSEI